MGKNIFKELNMKTREEVVIFLKSLWSEKPLSCPLCNGKLDYMHKKAKKSNSNWQCTDCGKIYKAVNIFSELPDK